MLSYALTLCALLPAIALGQQPSNVNIPLQCNSTWTAGTDEVTLNLPYNYNQVVSIVGDFKNLTWNGVDPADVTLNGTNNVPGTARFYNLQGLPVVEKLTEYHNRFFPGPYNEVHNTAPVMYPGYNVGAYIMYDGTQVIPICGGWASQVKMTAHFCATNTSTAQGLIHQLHSADAQLIGTMLGGKNFTNCWNWP